MVYYCLLFSLQMLQERNLGTDFDHAEVALFNEDKPKVAMLCPEPRPGFGAIWLNRHEADDFVLDFHWHGRCGYAKERRHELHVHGYRRCGNLAK